MATSVSVGAGDWATPEGARPGPVPAGGGGAGFRLRPVGVILSMSSLLPSYLKKFHKENL